MTRPTSEGTLERPAVDDPVVAAALALVRSELHRVLQGAADGGLVSLGVARLLSDIIDGR
jgi:hypothetical protein